MEKITQAFEYSGALIKFEVSDKNVMVNATEMAKVFGKRVDVFLKTDHANEFMSVLEFTPFGGNSAPLKKEEILITKGQSGTYMHRILALKFAAWLDPKFELWVYSTIDHILFGYANRISEQLKLIANKEKSIQELQEKLNQNADYLLLKTQEIELKQAKIAINKENKSQIEIFKS